MSDATRPAPERLSHATAYRSHTCGELRASHKGERVRLCGAVYRHVDEISLDLRDGYGITRVKLTPDGVAILARQLEGKTMAPLETILLIEGTVDERRKVDPGNPTGVIYVESDAVDVISLSRDQLLFDFKSEDIARWDRVRYRYLWLRNEKVHEAFRFRTHLQHALRRHLVDRGYQEVETPLLANKWTPEATEAFVAARDFQQVFALPGKRPIHGDILLTSGFDRVFEYARRFNRKATYGPFQQPEFTVLEANLSWVGPKDLYAEVDGLLAAVWTGFLGRTQPLPLTVMTSSEAMTRYGSEAPDLRFELPIRDVSALADISHLWRVRLAVQNGGALMALKVPGGAARLRELDELEERVIDPEATALHWISVRAAARVEVAGTAPLDEHLSREIALTSEAAPGDLILVAYGDTLSLAQRLAGDIRGYVGQTFGMKERDFAFARVIDLPYFDVDPETGAPVLKGDPLTRPLEGDLEGDLHAMRGHGFKLALNGTNIGGGAIRNHDLSLQRVLFSRFGYDSIETDKRFGQWLDVLRYGIPPRGRIAIGMDRLVALLLGLDSIEEVIALPKVWDGTDPLVRSPWPMDRGLVRALLGVS